MRAFAREDGEASHRFSILTIPSFSLLTAMMRLRHKLLIHAFRLSDQFSVWLALVLSVALLGGRRGHAFLRDFAVDYHPMTDFIAVALLAVVWGGIFSVIVRYDTNRFTSFTHTVAVVLKATTVCSFLLLGLAAIFDVEMVSQQVVLGHWIGANVLILASRGLIRVLLKMLRKSGYNRRNVVFVGVNERSVRLAASMDSKSELGYHIQGFVLPDDAPEQPSDTVKDRWGVVSRVGDFKPYLESGIVDEVMICLPLEERIREIFSIFRMCQELGVVVRIVPDGTAARVMERAQVEDFDGEHLVTFFRENLLWQ
jgi:FlaA1/EpsC-like NDP-sugar epimerase